MRVYLLLLISVSLPVTAQTETNIACVERLEIPSYPRLAGQARIQGLVITNVRLGPDGSVVSITSTSEHGKPHPLLLPSVEKSVRSSIFLKTCAGKQVELIFKFLIGGGPVSSLQWIPMVSFVYPNQFWIKAPDIQIQP